MRKGNMMCWRSVAPVCTVSYVGRSRTPHYGIATDSSLRARCPRRFARWCPVHRRRRPAAHESPEYGSHVLTRLLDGVLGGDAEAHERKHRYPDYPERDG